MKIPTTPGSGPQGAAPPSEASMLMALAMMHKQGLSLKGKQPGQSSRTANGLLPGSGSEVDS